MYIIPKSGLDHDNDETIEKKNHLKFRESAVRTTQVVEMESKLGNWHMQPSLPLQFQLQFSLLYNSLYICVYICIYRRACVYICSCSYRLTLSVVILYNNRHRLQIAVTTFECCSPGFPLCSFYHLIKYMGSLSLLLLRLRLLRLLLRRLSCCCSCC